MRDFPVLTVALLIVLFALGAASVIYDPPGELAAVLEGR
jgi:hypothetical protein